MSSLLSLAHISSLLSLAHISSLLSLVLISNLLSLALISSLLSLAHMSESAESLRQLAVILAGHFNDPKSEEMAERALEIEKSVHGPSHLHVADSHDVLGVIYLKTGKLPEAVSSVIQCLAIRQRILGVTNLSTINTLEAAVMLGAHLGADEIDRLTIALKWKEDQIGTENPALAISLSNLGRLCRERSRFADASAYFERAYKLTRTAWGDDHPETLVVRREILFLMLRQRKTLLDCIQLSSAILDSQRKWITSQLLGLSHKQAHAMLHSLVSDQTILHSLCGESTETTISNLTIQKN